MSHPLDPIAPDQWNAARARHLLERAGFGIPAGEIERLAGMTPENAVARLVDYEQFPEVLEEPDWLEPPDAGRKLRRQVAMMSEMNAAGATKKKDSYEEMMAEEERRRLFNALQAEERQDIERLKRWWLRRMIHTNRPLQEKMTLFWHGHFATSAEKVKSGAHNYGLNKLFRDRATGNFKMLTYEVGCSPAMLRYLDNDQNFKDHPNENWARELMELFTLGEGHYSEDDIKNSARAFSGWTSDGEEFVYNPRQHDDGEKVFMGRRGNFNGNDIIDIIFEQEQASRFIVAKLWKYFASERPAPEGVIDGLAATLRESGYEMKPMLRRMFLSRVFHDPAVTADLVKSPAQLAVSMMSRLDIRVPPDHVVERYVVAAMRAMGQDLFYPPNVKGWDGGRAWINTNTLMTRYNASNFLVAGVVTDIGGPGLGVQQMLQQIRRRVSGEQPKGRLAKAKVAMAQGMAGGQKMQSAMDGEGAMMDGGDMMMDDGSGMGPRDDIFAGVEMTPEDLKQVGTVGDARGPKGIKLPFAPFDATKFFARADGLPLEKVVDFLAEYFHGRPLNEDQRAKVLEALAGGVPATTPMNAAQWDVERLRGTIRLLLSTAENQVC